MTIQTLFHIKSARSHGIDAYPPGPVPFITNTAAGNGVAGMVEPLPGDFVFEGPLLCISGLGHATLQLSHCLPKGNGGDSCTVLLPKGSLSPEQLLWLAAAFNRQHKWRFSYGRKATTRRLAPLELDLPAPDEEAALSALLHGWSETAGQALQVQAFPSFNKPSPHIK